MEKYSHKRTFSVRYSDTDYKDELKPSALLAFLQEAACSSADELGFGYDDLRPLGYGFVVVSTCVELKKPLHLGDSLTVETWPLTPRMVIFERDYRIFNQEGELCAVAASRWCLVDLKNMSLLRPDKLKAHAACPYRDEQSMTPVWKIAKLGEEGELSYELTVKNSLCDHYLHLNNTRYADIFFDAFTMDELSSKKVTGFSIVYHKQVKEGQPLQIFCKNTPACTRMEARCNGEITTQFSLFFDEKE